MYKAGKIQYILYLTSECSLYLSSGKSSPGPRVAQEGWVEKQDSDQSQETHRVQEGDEQEFAQLVWLSA